MKSLTAFFCFVVLPGELLEFRQGVTIRPDAAHRSSRFIGLLTSMRIVRSFFFFLFFILPRDPPRRYFPTLNLSQLLCLMHV
jgi:hypothetical protein